MRLLQHGVRKGAAGLAGGQAGACAVPVKGACSAEKPALAPKASRSRGSLATAAAQSEKEMRPSLQTAVQGWEAGYLPVLVHLLDGEVHQVPHPFVLPVLLNILVASHLHTAALPVFIVTISENLRTTQL